MMPSQSAAIVGRGYIPVAQVGQSCGASGMPRPMNRIATQSAFAWSNGEYLVYKFFSALNKGGTNCLKCTPIVMLHKSRYIFQGNELWCMDWYEPNDRKEEMPPIPAKRLPAVMFAPPAVTMVRLGRGGMAVAKPTEHQTSEMAQPYLMRCGFASSTPSPHRIRFPLYCRNPEPCPCDRSE